MNKKVVIFSNSLDEHTHIVLKEIQDLGGTVYRVDTDRLPEYFKLRLDFQKENSFFCETPVGSFNSSEINAVYIRRPFTNYKTGEEYADLVSVEVLAIIKSIRDFFPNSTKIVDAYENVLLASRKLSVLKKAQEFGLDIPSTLVTSIKEEAETFIHAHKQDVIVKSIQKGFGTFNNKRISIPTTKFKPDTNLELVRNCPTLFQENIKKIKEFRIIVIGNKVFPVAFSTQDLPNGQTDFRLAFDDIHKVLHELVKLPIEIENKILKLVRYYGLHYSAIDMALTPEGKCVFFELNPAGQFLWLDFVTKDLHLAKEMAQYLLA